MNRQAFIASAVFTLSVNCAVATADQIPPFKGGLSNIENTTDNGVPTESFYFSTREDAEKALVGYNYALTLLQDDRVRAIVSGLNGSGSQNPMSVVLADSQKSLSKTSDPIQSDDSETPFPQISLKEKTNGQKAIDLLGDKLPLVAKAYGMSAERLENILKSDQTAWIDESGRLLYVEEDTKPIPKPAHNDTENTSNTVTISGADTFSSIASSTSDPFMLHSKPGSNRVIYLDFNGHVATNTAWYSGTLTAQAYDIDGNPSAFSDAELNNIKEIWQRVAEDYAPFDVDVTTQEPTLDAIRRTSSTDTRYGTRAVITRSMRQVCNKSCGGVAYLNVFSYYSSSRPDRYQPAWAFFDGLGDGYPKYVAEAVAHEVGHNLNLDHDGTSTVGYYAGHGSGATGWAPIMGVGYDNPVTQWSKGEYPDANNLQDDIAVIGSAGAPLRPDDYPNTTGDAAPLSGDPTAVFQTGIIERNADLDIFTFQTDGGNVQFNIASGSIAPNLDIAVKLMGSTGNTIALTNPANSLSSSLTATLAAGQYFLQIDGAGYGDLTTGYSDYASLGQYLITGSYPKNTSAQFQPTANITALPTFGDAPLTVSFDGTGSTDQDGNIVAYDWNYGDGSTHDTSSTASHIYNTPGTYTATLTVTDNSGLKNSSMQTINVTQSTADLSMKVSDTNLTRKLLGQGRSQCVAKVTVNYGATGVTGATVYGSWSGSVKTKSGYKAVTGSKAGKKTNSIGTVNITSNTLPNSMAGTCAFTVTNIVKKGYTYDGSGQVTSSFSW